MNFMTVILSIISSSMSICDNKDHNTVCLGIFQELVDYQHYFTLFIALIFRCKMEN